MRYVWVCAFAVAVLLSGCIPVDDFKEYWGKGVIDPELEGAWYQSESHDLAFTFSRAGDVYHVVEPPRENAVTKTSSDRVRTLMVGNHHFLMIKDSDDTSGGELGLYVVSDAMLTLYSPREEKKDSFLETYTGDNVVINEQAFGIKELDAETLRVLESIADQPDYWEITATYVRK